MFLDKNIVADVDSTNRTIVVVPFIFLLHTLELVKGLMLTYEPTVMKCPFNVSKIEESLPRSYLSQNNEKSTLLFNLN